MAEVGSSASSQFLSALQPAEPSANKTRVVWDLMRTKNIPSKDVDLLGMRKDGRTSFFYFRVPGAIVEIEIYWDTNSKQYERRFSDVFDNPREVAKMLGLVH